MNLQQDTRNGYDISAEIKKLWAVEMELLKKLMEVCEKHHLKIWAEGGTLLGTIRHKGYIPWDDDIDMAMPREDYDKLQVIANDEFHYPYFFQTGYTDLFPYGMAKLRMEGTTAITAGSIPYEFHQGIFIDIFPLDTVPDDEMQLNRFIENIEVKRSEMKLYCNHVFSWTNPKYNWKIIKLKGKVNPQGFSNYFRAYDEFCKQFMNTTNKRVSLISWKWQPRYLREKEWYDNTIMLPFEDIMMPVPSGYNEILTIQFGDYMTPIQAPSMHGGIEIFDVEHSYKEVLPQIRKKHRWDNWNARKDWLLKIIHLHR
jgi:lipopolysaccharide cholinephosphotransferase